jgi:hypothetical protein
MTNRERDENHAAVRDRYAGAARAASDSATDEPGMASRLFGRTLYDGDDIDALPPHALWRRSDAAIPPCSPI